MTKAAFFLMVGGATLYLIDSFTDGKVYTAADSPLHGVATSLPGKLNLGAALMAGGGAIMAFQRWG